jgi:hypothetical protein
MCDGSIVYYGPAKDALDYFAALGYECPPNYNPADFLLGLLSVSTTTSLSSLSPSPSPTKSGGKKSSAREHLISSYAQYSSKKEDIESGGRGQQKSELPAPSKGSDYPASWFQQFLILLHRSLVLQKPKIFDKIPLIQILSVAIIIGLLWLRVDKTEERIQDRLAIVFFIAIFAGGFVPLLSAVFSIPLDRAVVGKERASKAYNISAYFIAKNISELPLQFAYPTIFVCITYWMIGLNSDPGRFFTYLGLILLSNFTSSSLGLLAGALFLDITVATLAASVLTLSIMLVGGFFLQLSFLGWWIRWTQYLSFLRYLYYALLTNELSGNIHFKQQKDVVSPYDGYDPIYGKDVLKVLGISDEPLEVWSYALVILGFAILFRTSAFLAVRYLHQPPNK